LGTASGGSGVQRGLLSMPISWRAGALSGEGAPSTVRPFWSSRAAWPSTLTPLASMSVSEVACAAPGARCVVTVSTRLPMCSSAVPVGTGSARPPGRAGTCRSTSCSVVTTREIAGPVAPLTSTCELVRPMRRPSAGMLTALPTPASATPTPGPAVAEPEELCALTSPSRSGKSGGTLSLLPTG
jgi:hypothetical protein